jgi:hypothetical protein
MSSGLCSEGGCIGEAFNMYGGKIEILVKF